MFVKASISLDLAARLFDLTTRLARRSGNSTLALIDESALTPGQLKALLVLSAEARPLLVGQLAEKLDFSLPTVSRVVDALVQRGLVDREVAERDRRARELTISGEGVAFVERFTAARIADLRVFTDGLSLEKQERLAAALADLPLDPAEAVDA